MSKKSEKTNSAQPASKIIVISPEQLAKMGLTSAIHNLVKSQTSSTNLAKNPKSDLASKSSSSSSEDVDKFNKQNLDIIKGKTFMSKCKEPNKTKEVEESPISDNAFKKPLTSTLVSTPVMKKNLPKCINNRIKAKPNVKRVGKNGRKSQNNDESNDSCDSQSIIQGQNDIQQETPPKSKTVDETKQNKNKEPVRLSGSRGRKRKLDEDAPNLLDTNSPVASPRGRKRRILDYARLNSGDIDEDFEEIGGSTSTELVTSKSKNQKLTDANVDIEINSEPSLDNIPVDKKRDGQKKSEETKPEDNLQKSKKRKISKSKVNTSTPLEDKRSQNIDEARDVIENATTKEDNLNSLEKSKPENSDREVRRLPNMEKESIECSELEIAQNINETGSSLDCSIAENEIKPKVTKKKVGRPRKVREESVNPSPTLEQSSEKSINHDDKEESRVDSERTSKNEIGKPHRVEDEPINQVDASNESSSLLEETLDNSKPANVKRRRGRPRKSEVIEDGNKSDNFEPAVSSEANSLSEERPKRQPARSTRILDSDYVSIDGSDSEETKSETPKKETNKSTKNTSATEKIAKKRGGKSVGDNSILCILLKQYVDRLQKVLAGEENLLNEHDSQKNKSQEGGNLVKCVICKEMIKKTSFSAHKNKHNNIAWIEGEKPLDLSDFQELSKILSTTCKKKDLRCDFCGTKKKSVIGFLGHYNICLKSPLEIQELKIPCPFCGHALMPFSAPAHYKANHPDLIERKYNKSVVIEPPIVNSEDPEDGSNKRKAAVKAKELLNILKEKGGIVDGSNDGKPIKSAIAINFKFKPTTTFKSVIGAELAKNSQVNCRFKECIFTSKDVKEMLDHISTCEHKPLNNFTCKLCITPFATFEEAESHVDSVHIVEQDYKEDSEDKSDDDDDEKDDLGLDSRSPNHKPRNFSVMKLYRINFLEGSIHQYRFNMYTPAYKWHLKFCENNFSVKQLFENIINSDQKLLDISSIGDYLPKLTKSMYVSKTYVQKLNVEINSVPQPRQFKLFESEVDINKNMMVFCGGPVESLAWLPTPHNSEDEEQILAVAVNLDPNSRVTTSPNTTNRGLIQFWNFGNMKMKWEEPKQPQLAFCFAHDFGVIHQIQWCPSGCYTEKSLGLLAVASGDSNVYLYVVKRENLGRKFFKPKPAVRLSVNISEKSKGLAESPYVPTRISWSKAKDHNYIVVGYYNGTIALYKLNCVRKIEDDVSLITPILVFHAHAHAITFLEMSPLNGGNRWLVSGSLDRILRYWDLNNPTVPILSHRKAHITSGVWLHHWLGVMISYDDGTAILPNGTSYTYFRNKVPTNILYSMSSINCMSGSEWSNTYIQASLTGEVTGAYPTQLFWNGEKDKRLSKKRFMISYVRLLKKGETSIIPVNVADKVEMKRVELNCNEPMDSKYEPRTYEEAKETYNVTFCDFKLDDPTDYVPVNNADAKSGFLEETKLNRYPLASVNKIAINPNKQCFNYLASGYQIGFVKVHSLFSKFRI